MVRPALVAGFASGCGSPSGCAKRKVIKDFIAGEDFSIFNETTLALQEMVPGLRGDPDLDATNEGVTIVWLK
jgi:hypothetical protein